MIAFLEWKKNNSNENQQTITQLNQQWDCLSVLQPECILTDHLSV